MFFTENISLLVEMGPLCKEGLKSQVPHNQSKNILLRAVTIFPKIGNSNIISI